MAKEKKTRKDVARSYRFDPETVDLIARLAGNLADPSTGRPYTATDVIRKAVRLLARKHLMGEKIS